MHNFPKPGQPRIFPTCPVRILRATGPDFDEYEIPFWCYRPTDAFGSLAHRIISAHSLNMQNTRCACNMPVVLGTLLCA